MKRRYSIIMSLLLCVIGGIYCKATSPNSTEAAEESLAERRGNNSYEHKLQVDSLIEDIKGKIDLATPINTGLKDDENPIWPWEDVLASMEEYPEKVYISHETCPDCGGNLVSLYYSSPTWTWKRLCGRAGPMIICPHCPKQIGFFLEIMN